MDFRQVNFCQFLFFDLKTLLEQLAHKLTVEINHSPEFTFGNFGHFNAFTVFKQTFRNRALIK